MKLSFEEAIALVEDERIRQDEKWGEIHSRLQSIPGFILVMEDELAEAKRGWLKNHPGKHSALREIVQVAAVAIACLEAHGGEGNAETWRKSPNDREA